MLRRGPGLHGALTMYGLTQCGVCRRPRIVDRLRSESTCPYCGCVQNTRDLVCHFESANQDAVREALAQATGYIPLDTMKKRRKIDEVDPYSTMVYRYEHCSDLEEKMVILAEGLTAIKGTFTLDDVREVAGDRAEKMVAAMLDRCIISEVRVSVYKA